MVERIKALVGEGFREVVLTGVDVTSYGPDLPGAPTLGQLIERIFRHVPDLPRLRLSSLDCIELDERLFEIAVTTTDQAEAGLAIAGAQTAGRERDDAWNEYRALALGGREELALRRAYETETEVANQLGAQELVEQA